MAGGPVQQSYAGVDFIPRSGIYEFGYRGAYWKGGGGSGLSGSTLWKKSVGGLNILISTFCLHYTIINLAFPSLKLLTFENAY
jgi:hypothetical protein